MLKSSTEFLKKTNEENGMLLCAADIFFAMDEDSESIETSTTETDPLEEDLLGNLLKTSLNYVSSAPINISETPLNYVPSASSAPINIPESSTLTESASDSAVEYFERRLRSSADNLSVGSPPQKVVTPKNRRII